MTLGDNANNSVYERNVNYVDVVIVGAGLIGASVALKLAQQSNLRITIVERSSPVKENKQKNLRVAALGNVAREFLQDIGIWSKLSTQAKYPYQAMKIWDENSQGELEFNSSDASKGSDSQQLGHIVDMNECLVLLHEALIASQNVNVLFDFNVDEIISTPEEALIINSDGQSLSAKLMIAADGSNSWVRNQLPLSFSQFSYQQQGIVAHIKTELSHQDTAWQKFCDTGPLAVLPLHNNESSIVWSVDEQSATELMALSDEAFAQKISRLLELRLGQVSLLSKRLSFELLSKRIAQYCYQRIVLVGDAAHQIHPLAGQGANLGFKDAKCLLKMIAQQGSVDKLNLRQYERERKFDNEQTDLMMSLLYRAYGDNTSWWTALRGLGMQAVNSSNKVKRMLVEQAMG